MELLKRFREPSSWAGLAVLSSLLAMFGIHIPADFFQLAPQLVDVVVKILVAFGVVGGGAAVLLPERPREP